MKRGDKETRAIEIVKLYRGNPNSLKITSNLADNNIHS